MDSMEEAIEQFNAFTGNDKPDVAKFYLESSNNSVETAVNTYMESGGAAPGAAADQPTAMQEDDAEDEQPGPKMTVNAANKDDEEQRWYTGGPQGGSGQEVIAPGQGKDMMNDMMTSLAPHARQGTSEDLASAKGAFTGSARTLDGQVKKEPKKPKKVVVKLFQNEVFTVDDGPPRDIYDPVNTAFLNSIKKQEVPPELQTLDATPIDLSLVQIPKDYDPSDFPKAAFTGKGQRLDGGASTSAPTMPPVSQPLTTWEGPDDSKPTTSIQIRMPDGSRLVGKFNLDQKIHEIRAFVAAARPTDRNQYQMLSGYPLAPVPDENATIEEGGLKGSVVVFKC